MANEGKDGEDRPCRGRVAELEAAPRIRKEGRVPRPIQPASLFVEVVEWGSA